MSSTVADVPVCQNRELTESGSTSTEPGAIGGKHWLMLATRDRSEHMKPFAFTWTLRATAAAIAMAACPPAGAHAEKASNIVIVIDGFQSPESVLIVGDRRFVSNIGKVLDPVTKDGDGYITEVSADGRIVALRAFPPAGETLDAPKGMAELNGTLYVADIDRVIGFDLATGERVFTAMAPGDQPSLLNDLATTPDGALLVTDTLRNAVYRLNIGSESFHLLTTDILGANGIAVGNGQAYVAALGANFSGGDVFRLDESGHAARLEKSPHGLFDGLAVLPDGQLLVSDWVAVDRPVSGSFLRVGDEGSEHVDIGVELHGPADFAFDSKDRTVWIPATLDNRLVVVKLP
jgi:glucose/arabinose dehydrogenase